MDAESIGGLMAVAVLLGIPDRICACPVGLRMRRVGSVLRRTTDRKLSSTGKTFPPKRGGILMISREKMGLVETVGMRTAVLFLTLGDLNERD